MKVALFGGTGFVGSYIVKELINQGYTPKVLIRPGSENKLVHPEKCEIVSGDIFNENSINEVINDVDATIYNIGIIRQFKRLGITYEKLHFQGAKNCIDIAKKNGVNKFILMSANGVKLNGTGYQTFKFQAEKYLKASVLNWTIFQPSVIFGDSKGLMEFCSQLKKDMLNLPFPAPLFFDGILPLNAGNFSMSPIHVTDVAKCFVASISNDKSNFQTYQLGGNKDYNWKEIIRIISKSYGKNKWAVPAPVLPIKLIALILDQFPWFPISRDQLTMLLEGNTCDSEKAYKDFQLQPKDFSSDNLSYLKNS
tara:strand:- start:1875 stop:2801 length:927 start_codon:yes stop_codon:yes gene_type:complete